MMDWTDWWDIGTWIGIFLVFIGALLVGGLKTR
jgi:uncharacterized membrane protein